jgi:hypothetical protein
MPFTRDLAFAGTVGNSYGEYRGTFISARKQVQVDLFVRGPWLVAYVSSPVGLNLSHVADSYRGEIMRYAKLHGYSDHVRIIYG